MSDEKDRYSKEDLDPRNDIFYAYQLLYVLIADHEKVKDVLVKPDARHLYEGFWEVAGKMLDTIDAMMDHEVPLYQKEKCLECNTKFQAIAAENSFSLYCPTCDFDLLLWDDGSRIDTEPTEQ